jgi:hypothetical protein
MGIIMKKNLMPTIYRSLNVLSLTVDREFEFIFRDFINPNEQNQIKHEYFIKISIKNIVI